MMCMRHSKFAKFCQYTLYFVAFMSLLVSCYYIYMIEAIEKTKSKSTTVIKESVPLSFEAPSFTICAEPPFKPSESKKYDLKHPVRDYFESWSAAR